MSEQVRDLRQQFEAMSQGFVKMSASGKKVYGPPSIPNTPSRTINNMLQTRCGKAYDNPVKAGISLYICTFFTVITKLYSMIHPDRSQHSHTKWMVSCGVVSAVIIIKSYLVYNLLLASAFVMHSVMYYGAIALALFGAGLGVSGAVFFDKDGDTGNHATFRAGVGSFKATVTTDFSKSQ